MVEVASLLRRCLAAGPDAQPDLGAINRAIGNADPYEQANISYFVGRFLELRGRPDAARAYFSRAARGRQTDANVRLAILALQRTGAATRDTANH